MLAGFIGSKNYKCSMQSSLVVIAILLCHLGDAYSKWDGLRVTFGRDPAKFFRVQPRTVAEAVQQGFAPVAGIDSCTASPHYNGRAFVKNSDRSLTLLYDTNGFIAGIQAGIPCEHPCRPVSNQTFPSMNIRPPFVLDGITNSHWIITAYFTHPHDICTVGRMQTDFDMHGTGDNLWLQTGMYPSNVTLIPKQENQLWTPWVQGKCFPVMGQHYWYNLTKTMDCDDFFPVFLLYNGGELNAFGWAFGADLPSINYEHPSGPVFPLFFDVIPDCLYQRSLSTMHIFLTANPFTNQC